MKRVIVQASASKADSEKVYQNKRNPNKFVEVKKTSDGHSYVRQYMKWDTDNGTVKNYNASKSNRGRYYRATQQTINQILEDYTEVTSETSISETNYSQMSFDFSHNGNYDELKVREAAETALGQYITLGTDFESVDYSMYPEYNDVSVSQCSTDFEYEGDYSREEIESRLASELSKCGVDLVATEFYDMNHAYKKN